MTAECIVFFEWQAIEVTFIEKKLYLHSETKVFTFLVNLLQDFYGAFLSYSLNFSLQPLIPYKILI